MILPYVWAAQGRIWGGGETQCITTSVFKTSRSTFFNNSRESYIQHSTTTLYCALRLALISHNPVLSSSPAKWPLGRPVPVSMMRSSMRWRRVGCRKPESSRWTRRRRTPVRWIPTRLREPTPNNICLWERHPSSSSGRPGRRQWRGVARVVSRMLRWARGRRIRRRLGRCVRR